MKISLNLLEMEGHAHMFCFPRYPWLMRKREYTSGVRPPVRRVSRYAKIASIRTVNTGEGLISVSKNGPHAVGGGGGGDETERGAIVCVEVPGSTAVACAEDRN
jgi:hypothetical protein